MTAAGERPLQRFAGRVAIVTGGGRGLGLAIATGFAAEGAHVALVGRTRATLDTAVAAIRKAGGSAEAFVGSVGDEEQAVAISRRLLETHGRIDVLVNNAGINPWYKPPEQTDLDQWRRIIDVNLTGVFIMSKHVGIAMLAQGSGAIINISSIAGSVALARTTAYCAAKGGVEMLTRSMALDWAKKGVRVNAVAPGYFETDLTEGLRDNEALRQRVTARTPLGRFGRPDEIVEACLFLASAAASYITGQSLRVDGGWTAG